MPLRAVNGLSPRKHLDILLDASNAGLRLLGLLDPVDNCVAVGAVELLEHSSRSGIGSECL